MGLLHDSTGLQPHEVLFGFPMPMPFDWRERTRDFTYRKERLNRKQKPRKQRKRSTLWLESLLIDPRPRYTTESRSQQCSSPPFQKR
jgi:hypothetical protein